MAGYTRYDYDVLVIGAGLASRAPLKRGGGVKVALICRSLLGKAHTVMAEAASRRRWPTWTTATTEGALLGHVRGGQ